MIESTTYKDSVANGELVPQITLSPLANPDEDWGPLELASILTKYLYQGSSSQPITSRFLSALINLFILLEILMRQCSPHLYQLQ